jgi:hypothetical protein
VNFVAIGLIVPDVLDRRKKRQVYLPILIRVIVANVVSEVNLWLARSLMAAP